MVVLVTGANGFVGRHLVRVLLGRGQAVRALVRDPAAAAGLEEGGARLCPGTLEDLSSLSSAARGVDDVVHLAALLTSPSPRAFRQVNVEGTERLLEAALRGGARSFLFVSSLSATGPSEPGRCVQDGDLPRPVSHYGRTKRAAEERLLARRDRLRALVLRPPVIYGPGDRGLLPFFRCVAAGWKPLLGRVSGLSLLHVEDLVTAILASLEGALPSGSVHHVGGGAAVSPSDLLGEIGMAYGVRPRALRVPSPILLPLAALADLAAAAGWRGVGFGLDKWRELREAAWVCADGPFRAATGWSPRVEWREGIARTAAWYREAGWVRGRSADYAVRGPSAR
jgi:nucleoside-diphosphate-sugar epimerase